MNFNCANAISAPWWREYISLGRVSIIHVNFAQASGSEVEALAWLSADEHVRAHRLERAHMKRAFVLCRAALRAHLCAHMACDNAELGFCVDTHGKPCATIGGQPRASAFNVSHSRSHGLLAFAPEGQLGIDVEDWDPHRRIDGAARRILSETEQRTLHGLPEAARRRLFFRLWTCKEALIKATGEGFTRRTSGFSVPDGILQGAIHGGNSALFRFPERPDTAWRLFNLESGEFAAALAHEVLPERAQAAEGKEGAEGRGERRRQDLR